MRLCYMSHASQDEADATSYLARSRRQRLNWANFESAAPLRSRFYNEQRHRADSRESERTHSKAARQPVVHDAHELFEAPTVDETSVQERARARALQVLIAVGVEDAKDQRDEMRLQFEVRRDLHCALEFR